MNRSHYLPHISFYYIIPYSLGNLYIAEQYNDAIRKVTISTGIITTIAGTGSAGSTGDGGPATSGELDRPYGVALDSAGTLLPYSSASSVIILSPLLGNVYIADYNNFLVRKVTVSTGVISSIAGTGASSFIGDNGQATSAGLDASCVTIDALGNIYFADSDNNRVRKITVSTGIITTIAGTGRDDFSGDGGAATSASLSPSDVALDASGREPALICLNFLLNSPLS